jgi:hypothetical protein
VRGEPGVVVERKHGALHSVQLGQFWSVTFELGSRCGSRSLVRPLRRERSRLGLGEWQRRSGIRGGAQEREGCTYGSRKLKKEREAVVGW